MPDNRGPQVLVQRVVLDLSPAFSELLDPAMPLHTALSEAITDEMRRIALELGVPGPISVDITTRRLDDEPFWLRLTVNGRQCRYPTEVLDSVRSYLEGRRLGPGEPADLLAWLVGLGHEATRTEPSSDTLFGRFFGLACAAIVKLQASVFLDAPHATLYGLAVSSKSFALWFKWQTAFAVWIPRMFGRVLDLRLSLAEIERVGTALQGMATPLDEHSVEQLIEALSPEVIELHVPGTYIAQLEPEGAYAEHELLRLTREALFSELGILVPRFRLVPLDGSGIETFYFRINHLDTVPLVGIAADELFVDQTDTQLHLQAIEARPALHPATLEPWSIVDARHRVALESLGSTVLDQLGYFVAALVGALRAHSGCFVTRRSVNAELTSLAGSYPALVQALADTNRLDQLTAILRALAADQVSIKDLRGILERLLDYSYHASEPARFLVLGDNFSISDYLGNNSPHDDIESFVRSGLRRRISHMYSYGSTTCVVYLLDNSIETMLVSASAGEGLPQAKIDAVLAAVSSEIEVLRARAPLARIPAILTTINARKPLRDALKLVYPRVPVLAYEDLMPTLNVQPIARISVTPSLAAG